ncbi:putative transcription factor [Corchorus olitorius]|uniref:Transcription factor n=1 Tax=Corchorus olitorius TaxID=93759 RepID=A0A1R3L4U9_9ROSI|nr:putative transcription factor [Corchorus olitorius]
MSVCGSSGRLFLEEKAPKGKRLLWVGDHERGVVAFFGSHQQDGRVSAENCGKVKFVHELVDRIKEGC